ncbi:MAG: hypothetical protein A2750_01000 [Candidatus Yanofskybacteria bacterium RIFCSPHIGHO2_01_FULL_45_42]|uniref:Uncharacterized protein n=3 Tax=Candidatus Yanofskyibacteriota TaxID=1752733 RepID=A0A1F8H3K7_9BACT|nr:MAG: hypothetical protein A2750_01000 [Candidatus Yanofskybacteria bacterium RIFCSPHIGHO2_01_FULL_45_42]OGN15491.1 MAG: hypothetical protein A3C81_01190 [Candidatus Yanofskybacteria bacterium RIFCSPHIGHO2_02_FULL_46_19]OGN27198.1 MAG: hypothetical protein A3B17_01100 [Candidatus Yanofskybacteria bacterium RIFCSPLOWO2_01_FULL_45_72]OGN31860.1 MAG: hypothetical protein A3J01_01735 [Candidatus Yanofskybacteria bacterium RIFCSPLOWO2_02_FULL_45_18]
MNFPNKNIVLIISVMAIFLLGAQIAQAAFPGVPLVPCGRNPISFTSTDINDVHRACSQCDLFKLARNILDFLSFGLMPIVAALLFTFAGLLILLGGAVPSQYKRGVDIFKNTLIGLLIMYSAWLITNTVIKSLQEGNTGGACLDSGFCSNDSSRTCTDNSQCVDAWYQFTCHTTVGGGTTSDTTTPPTGTKFGCNEQNQCVATADGQYPDNSCDGECEAPPVSQDCEQSFSVAATTGCSDITKCVNVNNYADMNSQSCATNNGNCVLSASAAAQAKKFIDAFKASAPSCSIAWSSTIQVTQQVSASSCHKKGTDDSGTCADFNISPPSEDCFDKFYQAAASSGALKYLLNEYIPACVKSTTTGGNIHVVFGGI